MSPIKSRVAAAIVGGVVTAGVVGGVAIAQTDVPSTINACVHRQTGAVRIAAAQADCTSTEAFVSWNQQGVKGDKGDPGAPGPAGAPGPKGDKGDR
ncbi:MAG: hypothetical protein M3203_13560, partial [Actinomycetota bacterium]|nr:hypothetical protein [Actinomycetota bacterium]